MRGLFSVDFAADIKMQKKKVYKKTNICSSFVRYIVQIKVWFNMNKRMFLKHAG